MPHVERCDGRGVCWGSRCEPGAFRNSQKLQRVARGGRGGTGRRSFERLTRGDAEGAGCNGAGSDFYLLFFSVTARVVSGSGHVHCLRFIKENELP